VVGIYIQGNYPRVKLRWKHKPAFLHPLQTCSARTSQNQHFDNREAKPPVSTNTAQVAAIDRSQGVEKVE